MITQARQEEIDSATKENPVTLTAEEAAELRMRHKHRFQMDVGAGKYVLPAVEGSPAAKALELKDKGLSNAAIAQELGLAESSVRSILGKTYVP
jgi:DNA-binding NarL/FixJ family response regulator